jgi:hypothetical protein
MLVDTGSAVTIVNDEVWNMLKINEPLETVSLAVKSVTQHAIEILGHKDIHFQLKPKA